MPKKKYSINWENDEPSSFEVNGMSYDSLDQVPDEADRSRLEAMMNASMDQEFEKEFEEFDREFEKELEAHKKTSANAEKLILGIFSGVALLMLLIALVFICQRHLENEQGGECAGSRGGNHSTSRICQRAGSRCSGLLFSGGRIRLQ